MLRMHSFCLKHTSQTHASILPISLPRTGTVTCHDDTASIHPRIPLALALTQDFLPIARLENEHH